MSVSNDDGGDDKYYYDVCSRQDTNWNVDVRIVSRRTGTT